MSMLGSNIKVHFVCSNKGEKVGLDYAGVRYRLYSVYNFIKSKNPGDNFAQLNNIEIATMSGCCKHMIQDSGLFTLMFGADKGKKQTIQTLTEWQDKLIDFTLQNNIKASIVEIDCQKVLGVNEAWYFRERMKKLLPNKQINVFHLEDGKRGLDRLIEFSEYIAISVPELRICRKGSYKEDIAKLAWYIKNRKPEIDIHLLGCTEMHMLKRNSFCTSADSSSWMSGYRYGSINGKHINSFSETELKLAEPYVRSKTEDRKQSIKRGKVIAVSAKIFKEKYEMAAGPQD